VEGKVCWDLYIDGLVVSSDGNLLDALATAIKVNAYLYWLLFHCLQF
jgi:exosome complex RNA-binding protein Rrp42 (RNase PH superfamily)